MNPIQFVPWVICDGINATLSGVVTCFFRRFFISNMVVMFPGIDYRPKAYRQIGIPKRVFVNREKNGSRGISKCKNYPSTYTRVNLNYFFSQFCRNASRICREPCAFIRVNKTDEPMIRLSVSVVVMVCVP